MDFKTYQQLARSTAIYPDLNNNIYYPALGLAGEAGEVCEKVKKIMRDNDGIISDVKRQEVIKEIGDVLWYVANLCNEFAVNMDDVAEKNIAKLLSRKERGVLKGSGDNR